MFSEEQMCKPTMVLQIGQPLPPRSSKVVFKLTSEQSLQIGRLTGSYPQFIEFGARSLDTRVAWRTDDAPAAD